MGKGGDRGAASSAEQGPLYREQQGKAVAIDRALLPFNRDEAARKRSHKRQVR